MLISIGLVVVSPWALRAIGGSNLDWNRLSSIGQTYGAVSAIIAAVALLGVVASLVVQRREAKAARINAQRNHHVDLMRMAMEDPLYMDCLGQYLTENFDTKRQRAYVNLLVAQWFSQYEIGEFNDKRLRVAATNVLTSLPGRGYWEAARQYWRENYSGRRARRFHRVLEEAYQEAVKKPPSRPPVGPAEVSERRAGRWWVLLGAAGCGAAAAVGLRAARRILRAGISRRSGRS
ncbi:MAG TPA: DUF6082 family protein [Pseudonocardiaceae bacterium]|nr:DUF6082 family protein [Pseudonocardiaceae bacterium]